MTCATQSGIVVFDIIPREPFKGGKNDDI